MSKRCPQCKSEKKGEHLPVSQRGPFVIYCDADWHNDTEDRP